MSEDLFRGKIEKWSWVKKPECSPTSTLKTSTKNTTKPDWTTCSKNTEKLAQSRYFFFFFFYKFTEHYSVLISELDVDMISRFVLQSNLNRFFSLSWSKILFSLFNTPENCHKFPYLSRFVGFRANICWGIGRS